MTTPGPERYRLTLEEGLAVRQLLTAVQKLPGPVRDLLDLVQAHCEPGQREAETALILASHLVDAAVSAAQLEDLITWAAQL